MRLFTNPWLWAAVAGSVVLQVLVVYVPFLQSAFGTTPLTLRDWGVCVGVASSVLWLREATKVIRRATPSAPPDVMALDPAASPPPSAPR